MSNATLKPKWGLTCYFRSEEERTQFLKDAKIDGTSRDFTDWVHATWERDVEEDYTDDLQYIEGYE